VPVEEIEQRNGWAWICSSDLARGDSVHPTGSDCLRGTTLLKPGQVLNGPAIAVAASVGKSRIKVAGTPRIAIVSTGDELVEVDQRPLAHQIRRSNPHALAASLRLHGCHDLQLDHVPDDRRRQETALKNLLHTSDVLLITGGVSKGRYDFIPDTLRSLGVKAVFHRVRQRPGRPMWFGVAPGGKLVFGLPGNPASCLVCLHRHVLPTIALLAGCAPSHPGSRGRDDRSRRSVALQRTTPKKTLTIFQPVRDGKPVTLNTSGDFLDLARSDGFIEIPEGTGSLRKGAPVRFWAWQ
jgi:molybdopterin molybdotransferase